MTSPLLVTSLDLNFQRRNISLNNEENRTIVKQNITELSQIQKLNDMVKLDFLKISPLTLFNSMVSISSQDKQEEMLLSQFSQLVEKIPEMDSKQASQQMKAVLREQNINMQQSMRKLNLDVKFLVKEIKTSSASNQDTDPANWSYAEFWQRVTETISSVKTDYVDFYADLMEKYTKLYQAWNDTAVKGSANAVTAGEDGNKLNFAPGSMNTAYKNFENELKSLASEMNNIPGWSSMPADQRQSFIDSLKPAFTVDKTGKISFDVDSYNSFSKLPAGVGGSKTEISTAGYQAWLAGFNSVGSTFQSNMQSFAQRYSQVNSTFDNLNKVLSGLISSLGDSAKEVYRSI